MAPPKKVSKSTYRDGYAEQAKKACQAGFTDKEVADLFGVAENTVNRWKLAHPEFSAALTVGKAPADERVERSLFHKAIGFKQKSVKIFPPRGLGGKPVLVEYVEQVPPDTTACIFWLKNRRPEQWRERHEVDHKGNVVLDARSIEEIKAEIRADAALLGIIPSSEPVGIAPGRKVNGGGNGTAH